MANRIESISSVVLIFLLFIKFGSTLDSNCCTNSSRYDLNKKVCRHSSGKLTGVLLECSRYILDAHEHERDQFYMDGNGSLIIGDEEEQQTVHKGEYVNNFY